MDEHRQSHDVEPEQVRSARSVTRRHLLKLTAARALGVGAANLVGVAAASAAGKSVFAAPLLAGGNITVLVSSGNGTAARALGESYTSHTGTTVEVLELPYDQTFQKLQIALSQGADAYDVASLDDPWIPQFAGNRFLVNLDEMFLNAGLTVNDQFHPQLLSLLRVDLFRFRSQLLVSNLYRDLRVALQIVEPGRVLSSTTIGGDDDEVAIVFEVAQGGGALLTSLAPRCREEQHVQPGHPTANRATRQTIQEDVDGQNYLENDLHTTSIALLRKRGTLSSVLPRGRWLSEYLDI